jgi:hypothetical protein
MRFYGRLQESKGSRVNSSSASASIALMLLIATGLLPPLATLMVSHQLLASMVSPPSNRDRPAWTLNRWIMLAHLFDRGTVLLGRLQSVAELKMQVLLDNDSFCIGVGTHSRDSVTVWPALWARRVPVCLQSIRSQWIVRLSHPSFPIQESSPSSIPTPSCLQR